MPRPSPSTRIPTISLSAGSAGDLYASSTQTSLVTWYFRLLRVPGTYRFMIEDGTGVVVGYIGQAAKSLARRFSLYRSRGRRPSYPLEKKTTSRNARRLISDLQLGKPCT